MDGWLLDKEIKVKKSGWGILDEYNAKENAVWDNPQPIVKWRILFNVPKTYWVVTSLA